MMLMEPLMFSFNQPNGEPQTPTRTPTALGDSFHTPKLESSFFDPRVNWDTADPYASSPEFLRTPNKFGLGNSNSLRAETTLDQHADTANIKDRWLSEQADSARRIRSVKPLPSVSEDGPRTVDSAKSAASMQTPPPTSASRRKASEFDQIDGMVGKGTTPRPGAHLETPSRLLGASPRMFGNLQSSPDLFQLASLDPAGSPFFPQQRLFWDHDSEPTNDGPLPSNTGNGFGAENSSASSNPQIPQLPTIDGPIDLPEFNSHAFGISSAPPTDAALFPAPFSTSPRVPVTKAEDPAMFLSSPARRFGGTQLTPDNRRFPRGIRQPYHHQTEEFKREELRRGQAPNGQAPGSFSHFPDDEDEDSTPRGGRPGLTRSLTHTAITSSSHRPLSQSGGVMASTSGIRKSPSKGRSSPTKSIRPTPLTRANSIASGAPTRSQSVVLRIGRDGRAKAEMQTVPEAPTGLTDPLTGMDLDGSATESEADPAEYSEYPVLLRHQSSFALFDSGRPPLSRSNSDSRPPSKGSYASTVGSSHSGRMSPWAGSSRGGTGRSTHRGSPENPKRTPKRHSSLLHSDATYTRGSVTSESLPEQEDDSGDAQHALRQVLKERRGARASVGGYGNRLPRSSQPFSHLRSSPPPLTSDFDIHPRHPNTSPTTLTDPDLATPCTDRYSNPSNGTRCICNSMDNGGHLMIQCDSCTHWLHTKCVGLERANLPSVYVCMFCAQTPTRRNRVRSSYGPTGQGPPSPLAHKSFRFR
ncbi:Zinc finger PHD-finger [Penicillium alfredii]|uniref:Zinc finger PHD-finger n=1 Tax=Penicillium alfredii TaxID=1506179 RepID=A0A9W9GA45_9EURO|nr:Zinc finger PHD-finger [Penicillium alfredii]KAJ5114307.1 Zinc finger PHD-finger [Penicillium alfredii]